MLRVVVKAGCCVVWVHLSIFICCPWCRWLGVVSGGWLRRTELVIALARLDSQ